MVRLTADLVEYSPTFLNTLGDREIDLRGNKITVIENTGAIGEQIDTIDLSDNNIGLLGGFARFQRVSKLILNNNKIKLISIKLNESLPNLTEVYLTNNNIKEFAQLEGLCKFEKLVRISLVKNPVSYKRNYREYLIHKIPTLKTIDFSRVKEEDRIRSRKLFSSEDSGGTLLAAGLVGDEMEVVDISETKDSEGSGLSAIQITKIKNAIEGANTLTEVHRLQAILQSGKMPQDMDIEA